MSDRGNGTYDGTMADWYREVEVIDGKSFVNNGQSFDAFGRTEVSQITTQLDLKQSSGELLDFIDTVTVGTGQKVYNSNESSTTLSVTTVGDKAICQTFQHTNYQTGKAKNLKMTFYDFAPQTDVIKYIGYYSTDFGAPYSANVDGIYLESSFGTLHTNVYAFGTQSSRTSAIDWNGKDISSIDWNENQLLRITLAWLGVAAVKWQLYVSGEWVTFHTDIFQNVSKGVYMRSPNQPFRWEINSFGGVGGFTFICSSAEIEGSENQIGKIKGVDRGSNFQNANSTLSTYANIGMALDETKPSSFKAAVVDVIGLSAVALTTDAYLWRLYRNPTISGTALSWSSTSNSGVKTFIGADDNIITGGDVIQSGYVTQRGDVVLDVDNSIKLGVDLDGNPDIFVVGIQPLGANLDILCSINWRELD